MELLPGQVFVIKKFDAPQYGGEIKDIWLLYLAGTGAFSDPIYLYSFRFTTQVQKYAKHSINGERTTRQTLLFKAGEYGLTDDSVLDLSARPYRLTKEEFDNKYAAKSEPKGKLAEHKLKEVWSKARENDFIPPRDVAKLRDNLNLHGITGIK